jgi:hypothetical protein
VRRRDIIGGLMLAALPAVAWAAPKSVPLTKAFPYLDALLGYPAAKRSRFYVAYVARRGARPAPDFKAVIVGANGQRAPLALDGAGRVLRLPSLAELHSAATLQWDDAAGDVKLGIELRPMAPVGTHVDAADLNIAALQANTAASSLAGAMSFMVPKLDTIYFPGAGGGQAIFAGGRATPLPMNVSKIMGSTPYFVAGTPGVQQVVLARAPSQMLIGPHPKT